MPFMMRLACAFTRLPPLRIGCERPFSTRAAEAPVGDDAIRCDACAVREQGETVGHVTTSEYGSQMLSLGGVRHLTGGSRREGTATCDALLNLCNGKAVELAIDDGVKVVVQSGKSPIVEGVPEERMRVGCGSATIGMFAQQWFGKVDEVVVVDDHITGVLSEHQAGKMLGVPEI